MRLRWQAGQPISMEWSMVNYQFGWYSWMSLAAGIVGLAVAYAIWRRRSAVGAGFLMWLELAVSSWALAIAFEAAATTVPLKLLWSQLAYPGTTMAAVFYFLFAMAYGRHDWFLTRRSVILLSIVPAFTVLAAATNSWHGWLWSEIVIDPATNIARYGHGWFFWVFAAYTYGLIMLGVLSLLSSAARVVHLYRTQFLAILLGALAPLVANVSYLFVRSEVSQYDFTPLGFMVTGIVLSWAIFRYRVLDLAPVARDRVVDTMHDPVIVVDAGGRVHDMNDAMRTLAGVGRRPVVGRPVTEAMSPLHGLAALLAPGPDRPAEFFLEGPAGGRYFDVQRSPLRDRYGNLIAEICVLRDVTRRRQLEDERAGLLQGLQEALAQVKTLSNLLPICPQCKRIRDDQGYWHSVEAYLAEHSEAEFTHGICPDCMRRLYPAYLQSGDETTDDLS
jgi:PAS domain S-box-containing protein